MVGQFTDRRGHTRNFAYRIVSTVASSPLDDGRVVELNPAAVRDSTIDGRLHVEIKRGKRLELIKETIRAFERSHA